MTTVYIETSIASCYFTGRIDPLSLSRQHWTRQWWSELADEFDRYSSPAVTVELDRGTLVELKSKLIALVNDLPMLEISSEVRDIARLYVDRLLMPNDADGDAVHLAITSFHQLEVLLTWNGKHLANPNKFGHIAKINGELGLPVPLITTPLNYLSEDDSDGT